MKRKYNLDLEIEPISDEILETVLGGIGDEDGLFKSCSTQDCSNTGSTTG